MPAVSSSATRSKRPASAEPARVAAALNRLDLTTLFGRARFATEAKEHGLQVGHDMVLRQWQKRAGRLGAGGDLAAARQDRESAGLVRFGRAWSDLPAKIRSYLLSTLGFGGKMNRYSAILTRP